MQMLEMLEPPTSVFIPEDTSSVASFLPEAVQPYVPMAINVLIAGGILLLGAFIARRLDTLALRAFRARKMDEALARFLASLVRWAVLAVAVIASLEHVGVQTTGFVAILASAGLAVGLALQGSLSHFASGVMLLLFRPFSIGDVVEVGGKTGGVDEIGLFATTLKTPGGDTIIIPNASITGGVITNHTRVGRRRAAISIGVAYGADLAKVQEVLETAVKSVSEVLDDPGPGVALSGFGASSVDYVVLPWSTVEDYLPMQHKVKVALYDALNAADIEIPFNQIVVHNAP